MENLKETVDISCKLQISGDEQRGTRTTGTGLDTQRAGKGVKCC